MSRESVVTLPVFPYADLPFFPALTATPSPLLHLRPPAQGLSTTRAYSPSTPALPNLSHHYMKRFCFLATLTAIALLSAHADEKSAAPTDGWKSLFDGKSLAGWKSSEAGEGVKDVFTVKDGSLIVKGGRAHLFYAGEVNGAKFKNFEFKAKVLTKKNANSGIYFHTEFEEKGWPAKGYECQVNNSFNKDPRRTGSLYAVLDFKDTPFQDDSWMDYRIKVEGKRVTITVNGTVTADYTEKEGDPRADGDQKKYRWLSEGTFAFQAHDPGCEVHYRDIMVKSLP